MKLARFNGDFQHPKNDKYVHIHWDEDSHCEAIVGAVLKECMNQAIVVTTKGKVFVLAKRCLWVPLKSRSRRHARRKTRWQKSVQVGWHAGRTKRAWSYGRKWRQGLARPELN